MAGPRPPEPTDVYTVSALNRHARATLEESFTSVWVTGEISQISRPASGHIYFSLKDESSCLSATMFKGAQIRGVRFDLKEGLQVLAHGKLTIYDAQGKYQINVVEMLPKGIGALELAFQQLKEKLQAKGYFDSGRKKPLPRFARSIALVTSPSGAAVRDMLELLARRWPVASVVVVPVRVQGDGAAAEIAVAIARLNQLQSTGAIRLDAIIAGRGGGSLEDLWAFNEEQVADAIFASQIPIISAVGHETDFTIADMVADHRALTPSHAITDLTPDLLELRTTVAQLGSRLNERMTRRIEFARQRVDGLAQRRVFRSPLDRVRDLERRLDELDVRLLRAAVLPLEKARTQLASVAGRLESLSPLNVLSRGYSLTLAPDGSVLRRAESVRAGDVVRTRLATGEITSRVESTTSEESP
jgi:exodeoxyribonuclease VII large subunit